MTRHAATVSWQAAPGAFQRGRFSRAHRWQFDGGLDVPASASPEVIPPPWSDPAAIDPEEAFVAAIASCHMLSFLHLANRAGFEVLSYRDDAVGTLAKNAAGQRWIATVTLRPAVRYAAHAAPAAAAAAALHDQAHAICFIANSVRTVVEVVPRAADDAS